MSEHQQHEIDWNGEAYHRLSDLQYTQGMQLLDALHLRGDERVLDAGCGSGRITCELLARLPRGGVVGVDLSERMLEAAHRCVIPEEGQRAAFIRADLQTFVLPETFDGIFSNMALHFVEDHTALFANFARMLAPGGWLALQYGTRQTQHPAILRMLHMLQEPPYSDYLSARVFAFTGGDTDADRDALERAGFADIDVRVIAATPSPEHAEKMREFMRSTMLQDCLQRLPESMRSEFHQEAEAALSLSFAARTSFEYLQVRATLPKVH
ncbi:MAG TPA: methyltransferase domain-containing protein [Myxococcota bacterium]|nr:methyltransferase domain-containing protein [Myxococcota bacterium]